MKASEQIDILLVDDRPENLLTLEVVLESTEYNLVKAASGQEALKYLLDNDCALILMDVQMPEMDGFETAAYIKKSERSRDIPIIFVTAINKDERFVHEGYRKGAVDYIFKPFEPEILRSKVEVFVELYRAREKIKAQSLLLHESDMKEYERALAQLELKSLRRDQAAQQRYKDLVDGIDHGIIWSADSNSLALSFISPSAQRLLGYPLDQCFSGAGFLLSIVHPDDRESLNEVFNQARQSKKDRHLEHRIIRADGSVAWYHTGLRLSKKGEERGTEFRGLSVDITGLKETQRALELSEDRAQLLAEASFLLSETLEPEQSLAKFGALAVPRFADGFGIDLVDPSGSLQTLVRTTDQSPRFSVLSELQLHALNTPANTGLLRRDCGAAENQISESLQKKWEESGLKSAIILPLTTRGKNLGTLTFIMSDSDRSFDAADLEMTRDLARRTTLAIDNARLYKQTQEAVRVRDEFLSVASHELRTPLTPLKLQIQMMIRLLKESVPGVAISEKLLKMTETSERQIVRLSQLIDELLDISRINIGRLDLKLDEFSLAELIQEVIERFADQLNLSKCPVELKVHSDARGHWDHFRTEQVVINLLTNAMKYGAGKPIQMEIMATPEDVIFKVRDQGIGIDPKDQARIFERFERAVSPTHFGGLGLGLYIAKEIVGLHSGSIQVDSRYGEGATFTITLPRKLSSEDVENRFQPSAATH